MVRSVADRAFLPAKSMFEQVGNMMILTGKTITATVRPPFPYGGEFVSQFLFALQLCWFPMMISTIAFGFGAPGLQAANFLSLFGALDRLGGFFILASVREFAPFVTAVVVAGVAGTAITADLGARKIREELDALQVLGVDPIKNLVMPRFLSLMVVTGLFNITRPAVVSWMTRFQSGALRAHGYKAGERCSQRSSPPELCPAFSLTNIFSSAGARDQAAV